MSAANWGIGGVGGLNIFFRGRNATKLRLFLTSEVIFSLVRLFLKNSLKRFFGQ